MKAKGMPCRLCWCFHFPQLNMCHTAVAIVVAVAACLLPFSMYIQNAFEHTFYKLGDDCHLLHLVLCHGYWKLYNATNDDGKLCSFILVRKIDVSTGMLRRVTAAFNWFNMRCSTFTAFTQIIPKILISSSQTQQEENIHYCCLLSLFCCTIFICLSALFLMSIPGW